MPIFRFGSDDDRKKVGRAFMRVMGDVLGEQEAFEALQNDNYW